MDLTSPLLPLTLEIPDLVTVEEAFSGFSKPAVTTVGAMFVIGAGTSNTGFAYLTVEKLLFFFKYVPKANPGTGDDLNPSGPGIRRTY